MGWTHRRLPKRSKTVKKPSPKLFLTVFEGSCHEKWGGGSSGAGGSGGGHFWSQNPFKNFQEKLLEKAGPSAGWPASRPAGWPAALYALSALFVKSRIRRKKSDPPPFCNFLPCLPEPSRKVYIPVFQGAGDWKINLFLWIYFFLFFWKTRKTREIVSLEVGANRQVRPRAAISKLDLGKNLKTIWLGRKWSLDHRTCDQSCPGLKKKVFKPLLHL